MSADSRTVSGEAGRARTCEAKVDGTWRSYACGRRAKVERNGKHFCGTHDPQKREARARKRIAVRSLETAVRSATWCVEGREKALAEAVASFGGELPAPIARARAELLKARADLRSCKAQLGGSLPDSRDRAGTEEGRRE